MNKIEQRVQRGAEFLDRTAPGWAEKVDPRWLDLSSDADCVLGQVHGDFSEFMDKRYHVLFRRPERHPFLTLVNRIMVSPWALPWAVRHGFLVSRSEQMETENAWRKAVAARATPPKPKRKRDWSTEFDQIVDRIDDRIAWAS